MSSIFQSPLFRATPLLLAALLLSASGCIFSGDDEARVVGGGVGELVLAGVTELQLPSQVASGEPLTVQVRGEHPDGCTTFERFETERLADLIELTAWSFRPLGGCNSPGLPFEAQTTLAALAPGVYRVRVNGSLEASVAVLGYGGVPLCQDAPTVSLETVELPSTTHLGGSAELIVSGSLPSWCDRLLPATQSINGDLLQVELAAEGCALSAYDPSLCPEGPQPFLQRVALDFPADGLWRISVNGQTFGTVSVVSTASCRITPLTVIALEAPSRVEAQTAFHVALEGSLSTECAAIDGIAVDASTSTLVLDPTVRECAAACPPNQGSAPVRTEVVIEGLPVGGYTLTLADDPRSWPLEVVAAGTCAPVALPAGSVEQVLLTTDLASLDGVAGQPVDVSIYGSLPAGCWDPPTLSGQVQGSTLALKTQSANCARSCNTEAMGFVASLAFPGGFTAGTYEVTVDGASFTTFTVQ